MALLELVFGPVVHNPLAGLGPGNRMVGHMFMVITGCMLAIGVLWAMYHCVSATIATAQSGEFLGERKSSPWYVIRTATGFLLLMPIFGGYCGAQIIMLWGTLMGVGLANLTLDAAISVLKSGGSMVATPTSPQATSLAKALFEANLCAESANVAIANMPNDIGIAAIDPGEKFNAITTGNTNHSNTNNTNHNNKIVLINARGLSCGGAEIDLIKPPARSSNLNSLTAYAAGSNTLYSQLLFAHQSALASMQSVLSTQAKRYVRMIHQQTQLPNALSIIDQAAYQYETKIRQAIHDVSNTIDGLSKVIETNLKRDGWIMMGAWYQTFAQANAQTANMANATAVSVSGTEIDQMPYPQLYRKVAAAYRQQYQQSASTSSAQQLINHLSTRTTDPKHLLAKIFPGQQIVQMAIDLNAGQGPAGSTNPLIGMKNLGDNILNLGWSALSAYASWKALERASDSGAGKIVSTIGNFVTDGMLGVIKGAAQGVLSALKPFIVALILQLFLFGAMFSIYIPMLPFLIWFSSVTAWFAVVSEAMIAAPLWAMVHLEGDGQGMGERSTYGYIFWLNVLFRPVFMVIGFVLAGAAVAVFGTLLNTMFGVAMQNAQYNSTTGLVSMIGFIVLYIGMCQTLCNVSFSLIHIVPDHVFSWIGDKIASHTGYAAVAPNKTWCQPKRLGR